MRKELITSALVQADMKKLESQMQDDESLTLNNKQLFNTEIINSEEKIYIVNTSCIPIEKLADIMQDQGRVIGIHFMNPVPMKDTVEVIKSKYTSLECEKSVLDLLKSINKCFNG